MVPYSHGELAQMEQAGKNAEHCVCCGDVIPEGIMVCPVCEGKYQKLKGKTMTLQEAIDKIRDIKNTMERWEGQKDYCEALETAIGELSKAKMNPQVEVVRCKDCICHPKMGNWGGEYEQKPPYRCPMEYEDEYYSFCPNPDDYCSYGIRRKDNE